MFENLTAMAVLPASDLDRATQWWHDVLGRDPLFTDDDGGMAIYDIGGTTVMVYETEFAGTAKNTALNLLTDDLDRDMTHLRTHGVVFHDYDMPGLKTVDGVAELGEERGAWFSDSEENIIAISTMSDAQMELWRRLHPTSGSA